MSVQSQIDRLAGAKTTIGNYLQQNGVAVPAGATLDEMALQLADVIEKQNKITASGILKGDGAGGVSAAVPGTDYLTEAPVTSVNGATGEVKSTFYVTVTQEVDDSVTADKTAEEIYAAYAAGYAVYANVRVRGADIPYTLPIVLAISNSGTVLLGFGALGSGAPTEAPIYLVAIYYGYYWSVVKGTLVRSTDIPKGVPSVTTADNGKFLRVVNGAWEAAAIDNANGGSF